MAVKERVVIAAADVADGAHICFLGGQLAVETLWREIFERNKFVEAEARIDGESLIIIIKIIMKRACLVSLALENGGQCLDGAD